MKIDWAKYPPLPEPPRLPAWRDTPEREAYWDERSRYSFRAVPFGGGRVGGCCSGRDGPDAHFRANPAR